MKFNNFIVSKGYKNIKLVRRSIGNYSARDSEWNYSDIPHLNHIHTKVDAYTLLSTKNDIISIFLQRIGPFLFPASVHISHTEASVHNYIMTILNIIISVKTTHIDIDQGCETITSYQFFYKGFFGWIVCIMAKHATKLNYKTLMAEDMPMRIQRGKLRNEGFKFALDSQSLIGFTDTLDITTSHVNGTFPFKSSEDIKIDIVGLSGQINIDKFKCTISWTQDTVLVLPMICHHEGANLCFTMPTDDVKDSIPTTKCPWHGKKVFPLAVLDRGYSSEKEYKYLHVTFSVELIASRGDVSSVAKLVLASKCPKI